MAILIRKELKLSNHPGSDRHLSPSLFLALSLGFGLSFFLGQAPLSFAADFSKAKQTYVPPTAIERRVDFGTLRESDTVNSSLKKGLKDGSMKVLKSGSKLKAKTMINSASATARKLNGMSNEQVSGAVQRMSSKVTPELVGKMRSTAKDLIASGKLDEAQRVLTKLSQISPEDKELAKQLADVSVARAKKYLNKENLESALHSARTALASDPANADAKAVLDKIHGRLGADPQNHIQRLNSAHKLYSQARFDEAAVEYKESLKLKNSADAHLGLAAVSMHKSGAEAAKKHIEKALEVEPHSAAAHREMGLLHSHTGNIVGANSELSRAVVLNTKDPHAGPSLVKLWQTQVAKIPNANSHLGLARAYQLTGDLKSAQAEYREVVRLEPNHPYLPAARQSFKLAQARQEAGVAFNGAKILEQSGSYREAFEKISEAVKLSPGDLNYRLYQGELLEKLGQPNQARLVYSQVLSADPQNALATAKLQSLSAVVDAAAIATASGLTPIPANSMMPGSKFDQLANPAVAAAAQNPLQGDHVGQLSGFLGSLRNQMLTQKTVLEKAEDSQREALKQISGGGALSPISQSSTTEALIGPAGAALSPSASIGSNSLPNPSAALAQAQQALSALPPMAPPLAPPIASSMAAPVAAPVTPPMIPTTAPPATRAYDGRSAETIMPPLRGLNTQPEPTAADVAYAASSANLKFELKEIKPSKDLVELKVSLRNESNNSFNIPKNFQTLVRYGNGSEVPVSTNFRSQSIPAKGQVLGTVKIPMSKVDPTADLVLRNVLPQGLLGSNDLHLSTAVSQR